MTLEKVAELEIPVPHDFQPFDPDAVSRIYHRNLPHWRQPGATYFVTIRLADSIPLAEWDQLQAMAESWRRELGLTETGKPGAHQQEEYSTFQRRYEGRVEKMLDHCHGACWLRDPVHRADVIEALLHFDGLRYQLKVAVIMPNHVHFLIRPEPGFELETLLGEMKSYSARQIHQRLGRTGSFWMPESYDRIVRSEEHFAEVAQYILANPAKAKLREGEFWWMTGD